MHNIDFTKQIKEMKEKDVLHKPFPVGDGYALFAKNNEGSFIKVLFSSKDQIKKYLNNLGYDWGNEGKDEYTNFDCELRLLRVLPELSEVETIAADPQWEISEKPVEFPENSSTRKMEDMPDAVMLREVDHPLHWDESNYDTKASEENLAKKPDFLKKKDDKKDDKKGDKKNGKEEDNEEKDKNGKKLPPWLKKKSKSRDYSDLYLKVKGHLRSAEGDYSGDLKVGDQVKNINKKCTHYKSEGKIKKLNKMSGDKGVTVSYQCTNAGKTWKEGDTLEKTPDQLAKGFCQKGRCVY